MWLGYVAAHYTALAAQGLIRFRAAGVCLRLIISYVQMSEQARRRGTQLIKLLTEFTAATGRCANFLTRETLLLRTEACASTGLIQFGRNKPVADKKRETSRGKNIHIGT